MEGMVANCKGDYERTDPRNLEIVCANEKAYLNELVAYCL
jgi:hypothetical protein